jgi:mycothiol synthase
VNVSQATAGERDAALRLLVAHRLPVDRNRAADRYRDLFSTGDLDPAGLFVSRDAKGAIRGAMMVAVMPGALGLAWPPVAARRTSQDVTDSLVVTACRWLQKRGVKVCQAFGGDLDRESFAPLERNGFRHLTRLTDLRCELNDEPPCDSRLSFEPVNDANRAAFETVLLATYEGSLDCPEVNGTRTEAELLASYADADTRLWFLSKLNHEAAGVVLLEADRESSACVLSYLGVAPKFRGRALGSDLVCFAQRTARSASHAALALSVDERNHPALHLYKTHGFQASGARSVFLADMSTHS